MIGAKVSSLCAAFILQKVQKSSKKYQLQIIQVSSLCFTTRFLFMKTLIAYILYIVARKTRYSQQRLVPFASLDYKYYDPVRCMKWNATINVTGEILDKLVTIT